MFDWLQCTAGALSPGDVIAFGESGIVAPAMVIGIDKFSHVIIDDAAEYYVLNVFLMRINPINFVNIRLTELATVLRRTM